MRALSRNRVQGKGHEELVSSAFGSAPTIKCHDDTIFAPQNPIKQGKTGRKTVMKFSGISFRERGSNCVSALRPGRDCAARFDLRFELRFDPSVGLRVGRPLRRLVLRIFLKR